MKKILYTLFTVLLLSSCANSVLDESVYSSLGESNYFKTASDAEALLNSAYSSEQRRGARNYIIMSDIPSGIMFDRKGGVEALAKPFELFTWDATHSFFLTAWRTHYLTIYRSNLIIDKVPAIEMDAARRTQIITEARFLRASAYVILDDLFGPVPLIETSNTSKDDKPLRPTEDAFNAYVEKEFSEVAEILPKVSPNYGRATKGASLSQLTKFYLNNKKWQLAANTAQKVTDLGVYGLYTSAKRTDLFDPINEVNNEFIYIRPSISTTLGDNYIGHAAPPDYKWKGKTKTNYATQFKTRTAFYNTFDPNDERRSAIITQYESNSSGLIKLGVDDLRSFKFQEDLVASGDASGNDFPVIRYADIILSRAEALNEISGPTQESIDLINLVREKAKVTPLVLSNFTTKEAFRTAIFKERSWEFFSEELFRQDLIRQGTFIQQAKDRGVAAVKDFHVLYPIPLNEITLNPNLVQNDGYTNK